jgi:PAS domain S-box-containing protein
MSKVYIEDFSSDVKKRSDRLMNYFLVGFFICGILLAFFYDTWMIAIGVGGLALVAYYSTKFLLPSSDLYQYVLSSVMGIYMAQYIYQMHGMFEMHFLAFISCTILITYRNWKLQIPIAVVVLIHHAAFGYLQFIGYDKVYFTQLDYMPLQTYVIHILLAIGIFFICGLWSYNFKISGEQQVKQSIELQRIFNTIEEVLFSLDPVNKRVLQVSSASKKLCGYAPADFIEDSKLWFKLIHPGDRHIIEKNDEQLERGIIVGCRFRIFHKNKTVRWVELKLIPTLNEKGELVRLDGICNNISERIKLEKQLAREIKEKQQFITAAAIKAQEKERAFLGGELHDNINQILATARLYMDCAISDDKKRVNFIEEGKVFINTAIREIRTLSNSLIPQPSDVSVKEAIIDISRDINRTKGLQVITDCKELDEGILCQEMKLTIFRIVQEQLNNILKHAKAKKAIIEIKQRPHALKLNIKDDGVGFDVTARRNGVGLQNIISRTELLNGDVVINSAPGKGCELRIHFGL